MTYGHLRADCLYTGISLGPNGPMTLTFELDIVVVKMNKPDRYLGQRSSHTKVIISTHTHTQWTYCTTWTTKVVRKSDLLHRNHVLDGVQIPQREGAIMMENGGPL